jgi:ABC-type nitrate/sulfonate/bicarbonate transport system ATPase subunit
MTATLTPPVPALSLDRLTVSRGGSTVLDGITLDIQTGEFVSVIGPSGCGKSTLLAALTGEVTIDGGTINVGDSNSDQLPPFAWMPQSDSLLPWRRLLENATLGLEVAGHPHREAVAKVAPLLEAFGLAGRERAWPNELSGGMRQRVALLRTVALGRPLLLLDEPFGALDAITRARMQEWLSEVRSQFGWTVLLITHDVREAVILSDRVFVLSPRPASISAEVRIDLPHPRSGSLATNPVSAEYQSTLMAHLLAGDQ